MKIDCPHIRADIAAIQNYTGQSPIWHFEPFHFLRSGISICGAPSSALHFLIRGVQSMATAVVGRGKSTRKDAVFKQIANFPPHTIRSQWKYEALANNLNSVLCWENKLE